MLDISQKVNKQKKLKKNKIKNKKQRENYQPISGRGKPNKNISENIEKFLKNIAASGFGVLTKEYIHV